MCKHGMKRSILGDSSWLTLPSGRYVIGVDAVLGIRLKTPNVRESCVAQSLDVIVNDDARDFVPLSICCSF